MYCAAARPTTDSMQSDWDKIRAAAQDYLNNKQVCFMEPKHILRGQYHYHLTQPVSCSHVWAHLQDMGLQQAIDNVGPELVEEVHKAYMCWFHARFVMWSEHNRVYVEKHTNLSDNQVLHYAAAENKFLARQASIKAGTKHFCERVYVPSDTMPCPTMVLSYLLRQQAIKDLYFSESNNLAKQEHDINLRESRNTLAKGVKKSTKRVRGETIDSTTLCTPFEKTGMSSKPWQRRKYPSTRVRKKRRKVQRGGERGK